MIKIVGSGLINAIFPKVDVWCIRIMRGVTGIIHVSLSTTLYVTDVLMSSTQIIIKR